jgi:hypothetical protein
MSSPTIDFRQIREHVGSKHRGFEEPVYQLIPSLDDIARVRHGTPDAGVEALVNFEDGPSREQKRLQKAQVAPPTRKQKAPLPGPSAVAGAGFEPATSGL